MAPASTDALVFFGATGDLAHKKVFPALQAMLKRGHLNVPVIGVAKAGWNLDQLRARARDSLETHGGVDGAAFDKLSSLLRYVDGDYQDPATFDLLRRELGSAQRPLHYLAIPPSLSATVVDQLGRSGCARGGRVVAEKPFGRDLGLCAGAQSLASGRVPRARPYSASTTTSAKRRCRTCSISASATRSSSRSGTATTSTACRSPWPRASASRGGGASTTRRARSATSSRTTCCR